MAIREIPLPFDWDIDDPGLLDVFDPGGYVGEQAYRNLRPEAWSGADPWAAPIAGGIAGLLPIGASFGLPDVPGAEFLRLGRGARKGLAAARKWAQNRVKSTAGWPLPDKPRWIPNPLNNWDKILVEQGRRGLEDSFGLLKKTAESLKANVAGEWTARQIRQALEGLSKQQGEIADSMMRYDRVYGTGIEAMHKSSPTRYWATGRGPLGEGFYKNPEGFIPRPPFVGY